MWRLHYSSSRSVELRYSSNSYQYKEYTAVYGYCTHLLHLWSCSIGCCTAVADCYILRAVPGIMFLGCVLLLVDCDYYYCCGWTFIPHLLRQQVRVLVLVWCIHASVRKQQQLLQPASHCCCHRWYSGFWFYDVQVRSEQPNTVKCSLLHTSIPLCALLCHTRQISTCIYRSIYNQPVLLCSLHYWCIICSLSKTEQDLCY